MSEIPLNTTENDPEPVKLASLESVTDACIESILQETCSLHHRIKSAHQCTSNSFTSLCSWILDAVAQMLLANSKATGIGGGFVGLYHEYLDNGKNSFLESENSDITHSSGKDIEYILFGYQQVRTFIESEGQIPTTLQGLQKCSTVGVGGEQWPLSHTSEETNGEGRGNRVTLESITVKVQSLRESNWSCAILPVRPKNANKELAIIVIMRPLPPILIESVPLPINMGLKCSKMLEEFGALLLAAPKPKVYLNSKSSSERVSHDAWMTCIYSSIFHCNTLAQGSKSKETVKKSTSGESILATSLFPSVLIDERYKAPKPGIGDIPGELLAKFIKQSYQWSVVQNSPMGAVSARVQSYDESNEPGTPTKRLIVIPICESASASKVLFFLCFLLLGSVPRQDNELIELFEGSISSFVRIRSNCKSFALYPMSGRDACEDQKTMYQIPATVEQIEIDNSFLQKISTLYRTVSSEYQEWKSSICCPQLKMQIDSLKKRNDQIAKNNEQYCDTYLTLEKVIRWGQSDTQLTGSDTFNSSVSVQFPTQMTFNSDCQRLIEGLDSRDNIEKAWPTRLANEALLPATECKINDPSIQLSCSFYVPNSLKRLCQETKIIKQLNLTSLLVDYIAFLPNPTRQFGCKGAKLWLCVDDSIVSMRRDTNRVLIIEQCDNSIVIESSKTPFVASVSLGLALEDTSDSRGSHSSTSLLNILTVQPKDADGCAWLGPTLPGITVVELRDLVSLGAMYLANCNDGIRDNHQSCMANTMQHEGQAKGEEVTQGVSLWIPISTLCASRFTLNAVIEIQLPKLITQDGLERNCPLTSFHPAVMGETDEDIVRCLSMYYSNALSSVHSEFIVALRDGVVLRPSMYSNSPQQDDARKCIEEKGANTALDYYFKREQNFFGSGYAARSPQEINNKRQT